jgi:hypothetical protein
MRYIFMLLFISLFISCGESFVQMDTEKFNMDIAQNSDINSPETLITLYYNYPESEGKPNLQITKKEIDKQVFEIILIHDYQQDDALKAEKVLMIAEKTGRNWHVKKISRNWNCYDGRGHTDWGTRSCN